MLAAHLDFETRSALDLKRSGVHRYAEDASTSAWGFAWCICEVGDVPDMQVWTPQTEHPWPLLEWIEGGGAVVAHNAAFERTIWNEKFARGASWPRIEISQQICTMSRAAALALPQGLDSLSSVLKTSMNKDADGYKLMRKMCKPKFTHPDGRHEWHDAPEQIARLMQYCEQDVRTEAEVDAGLPLLSAAEEKVWQLDQRINDRGVRIDELAVQRAVIAVKDAKRKADERMWWLTDGDVQTCTQTARIVAWLCARGIPCESVKKGEVADIILSAQIMSDEVAEEVIRLRRAAAKASTAKFQAMLNSVCRDSRVRGMLAYHGASTGRWAGRMVQPQNFPRADEELDLPDVMNIITIFNSSGIKPHELITAISMLVEEPMTSLSKCLRAMFVPAPGCKFVGGDFSNIEGRVNAWLAGEDWKVEAFEAYDAGTGEDLYKLAYARSFGAALTDVGKPQRQVGKVQELALGYQGGPGAYVNMAANYFIKPEWVASVARSAASPELWAETAAKYRKADSRGLAPETWTGIKIVVDGWRAGHPNIVQGWWDLQDAAVEAVGMPGVTVLVPQYRGLVKYRAANGFLFCSLPSRRVLAYANPRLIETEHNGRKRRVVQYHGIDPTTKRWDAQTLYGGEQCNHVVQGTARDLIVHSMFEAEEAGYPVVLTVHDELLTEVPNTPEYSDTRMRQLMSRKPAWADGLPLTASTWQGDRYAK